MKVIKLTDGLYKLLSSIISGQIVTCDSDLREFLREPFYRQEQSTYNRMSYFESLRERINPEGFRLTRKETPYIIKLVKEDLNAMKNFYSRELPAGMESKYQELIRKIEEALE